MKSTKIQLGLLCLALVPLLFACTSCETAGGGGDAEGVTTEATSQSAGSSLYLKYNIHYYFNKGKYYASYANYIEPLEHGFLPYNTKVTIGRYRGGFQLIADSMTVNFQLHTRNMGMSKNEYIDLITSPEPVNYGHLSTLDQEAISKGTVKEGMTKEGVMASWGYPATHKTPSTNEDTWTYWKDRFRRAAVIFEDGKVSSIVR